MSNADDGSDSFDEETNSAKAGPAESEVVGYGRPPRHSQFEKGISGNPKGRPKGSKNFSTYLDEELRQPVTVTEGGTRKRIPKAKAIAKRVVNGAVSGETKMVPMLLSYDRLQADQKTAYSPLEIPLTEADEAVSRAIIERIRFAERTPDLAAPVSADAAPIHHAVSDSHADQDQST